MTHQTEKGSALIIFVVVIVLLSAGIVGGSFYFKDKLPNKAINNNANTITPTLAASPSASKQTESDSEKNLLKLIADARATDPSPSTIPTLEENNDIAHVLICHFLLSNEQFPSNLNSINNQCLKLNISLIDPATGKSYDYQVTNSGKGFAVKSKLNGQDYIYTEKKFD